jgi:GAF domain-containing protein
VPDEKLVKLFGGRLVRGSFALGAGPGEAGKFGDDHVHFLNSAASIAAVTLENLLALESLKAENRRLRAELVLLDLERGASAFEAHHAPSRDQFERTAVVELGGPADG